MLRYTASRLLQIVPTVLGVTLLVFSLIWMIPGDPAMLLAGEEAGSEEVEALRRSLGLDRPIHIQYVTWLGGVVTGDWGTSIFRPRAVLPELLARLPATLELAFASMVLSVVVAVPLGVLSAIRQNSRFDSGGRIVSLLGLSMPNFWIGLLLILIFAYHLRWLPASGRGTLQHMILPTIALGTGMMAEVMRVTRSTMLEVVRQDYVRTAAAKGLRNFVVQYKHALRNALISVVTVIGLQLGFRLGGTVVIEQVFAYPGLGRLAYDAMLQRDIPIIMGTLLIFALMFLVINVIVDLLYSLLDPRIRYG